MNPTLRRARSSAADALRARLWPLPVALVVLGIVAGLALPRLDRHVDATLPSWFTSVLFTGDADTARSVLSSIATALMTVTSLTFSLTVVTLQLASSQFSPRLLRTFVRDVFVQTTLALFLATFVYSLAVLRSVRDDGTVPELSVTLGFLLAVASVVALALFLAHLASQIRVETMLLKVARESRTTIAAVLGDGRRDEAEPAFPDVPPAARRLVAPRSGFLLSIERERVRDAAAQAGAVVSVDVFPGCWLGQGSPLGRVWPADGTRGADMTDAVEHCLSDALHIGHERTAAQDVTFGLRQLTDVANKALSPGINDPTTAVIALGHISAVLGELGGRDLRPAVLLADDRPVVRFAEPAFADILDVALTQPRRYGAGDPQVLARLCSLLAELAWRLPHRADQLRGQLSLLAGTIDGADLQPAERRRLDEQLQQVRDALHANAAAGG